VANAAPSQGYDWSNQLQRTSNGAWSGQTVTPNDPYTLSGNKLSPAANPGANPTTDSSSATSQLAEKPIRVETSPPGPSASLVEITGSLDSNAETPTEDLPICLLRTVQEGAYPEKSLTINYGAELDRIAKEGHYYLVIDGDHIGHHEMPIEATKFKERGKLRVARLPEAGDGEPLRIYIEVEKPAFGRSRVRASNIVKTTVKIAGAPTSDIRHPKRLPLPAAAIHWQGNAVQFETKGEWYELIEIDGVPVSRIMEEAEKINPKDPHEQFEDHLPELMERVGHKPLETITLKVRNLAKHEEQVLRDIPFMKRLFDPGGGR
jgi:hypothetical protein